MNLTGRSDESPARNRALYVLVIGVVLLGLSIAASLLFTLTLTSDELAVPVAKAVDRQLASAEKEAIQLMENPTDRRLWLSVKHSFFLVDSGRVKAWSRHDFLPDWRAALAMTQVQLVQTSSHDYLLQEWRMRGSSHLLLVIPLYKDYDIVNNYLNPEWNSEIFDGPVTILDPSLRRGASVCTEKYGCLFSIEAPVDAGPSKLTYFIFSLFIVALALIVAGVAMLLLRLHRRGKFQKTFIWLTVFVVGIRIALVEFGFPNALIKFRLFDPKQFASSSFNASIGDLFLNSIAVLILALYLFNFYTRFPLVRRAMHTSRPKQGIVSVVALVIAFLALLLPFLYCEVIYHNSSISLEITESLIFENTRLVAFASLVIGSVTSFLVMHIALRLAVVMRRQTRYPFALLLLVASVAFVLYFMTAGRSYWITLVIGVMLFPTIYFLNMAMPVARLTFKSFLYFLVIVIAFAVQATLSVGKFQDEGNAASLFHYGTNFLVEQDVLGEYLLNESTRRIEKDPYIQLRLASPFLSKASVRQKIKLFYLPNYFDRYDVQVYLYNSKGEPYENTYSIDFERSIRGYQKEIYKTNYPGIFYINNPSADATKKYLVIIPVRRFGAVAGYAVLDLTLKKIIPQNVYPELLVDHRFSQYIGNPQISYAWFSQGKLKGSVGDFNYERDFDPDLLSKKSLFTKGIQKDEFLHVAMEEKEGLQVVITGLRYPMSQRITNFSFFFIVGLIVILGFLFFTGVGSLMRGRQVNYSSRIQLYVYLAFFFPLVAVSITTLSLISNANRDRMIRDYGSRATMMSQRMSGALQQFISSSSRISQGPRQTQGELQNQLIEVAKLASADASVYSVYGSLLASSQPAIFENHLFSVLISRKAWNSIVVQGENAVMANEQIGKLNYNCSYAAIKSPETGKLIGILSVPFFSSASSLEKSQIDVLSNILVVFVIIFILFSFLSFFVAKGLTFPLRFITQSLKRTSLTETNQPIRWDSKDEIGLLATEYNRMVKNLEQSKADLVRSQKESTWREIAKQVAHEIKNPLTPMKLTLQQWERSLLNGEVSPEKARKSIELLLAQLETLNDIAGSFSAFARMPQPVLERIDLGPLLKQVTSLHAVYHEGTVTLHGAEAPVFVMGDEQLLGRIFSNLILNALQSGREGQKVEVNVYLKQLPDTVQIEVSDNGKGIEEWVRDRVFLPHFSTKKTGSGLGLPIVRQGIEQSGGRIWFETVTNKGTTFFIEFPV